MSSDHLSPPKIARLSAASKLRSLAELNFLHNVSAYWIVPPLAVLSLGYLVYFVAN